MCGVWRRESPRKKMTIKERERAREEGLGDVKERRRRRETRNSGKGDNR